MAQAGYTPIQLYFSSTASAVPLSGNLIAGELALNTNDGKLYFKDSTGLIKVIADSTIAGGSLPGGTAGAIPFQSAPNTTTFLSIGSANYILTSSGSVPQYTNPASITVGLASNATNLSGGTANQIAYQSGIGSTTFAPAPTVNGSVLGWNGSSFNWVSAPAATTAANLSGGSAGVVPFQTAPGTTSFTAVGTNNYVLTSAGTGTPTWNQVSLTASVSGILPIVNGGTGQSTANAAFNALAPNQSGNDGKYLSTNGTNTSWATAVTQSDVNQTAIAFSLIFGG